MIAGWIEDGTVTARAGGADFGSGSGGRRDKGC